MEPGATCWLSLRPYDKRIAEVLLLYDGRFPGIEESHPGYLHRLSAKEGSITLVGIGKLLMNATFFALLYTNMILVDEIIVVAATYRLSGKFAICVMDMLAVQEDIKDVKDMASDIIFLVCLRLQIILSTDPPQLHLTSHPTYFGCSPRVDASFGCLGTWNKDGYG